MCIGTTLVFGGFFLERKPKVGLVRDDDGNGLLGVGRGMNADIGNEVARFVNGFETLEGDVL